MRIALVHDRVTIPGGSEDVLKHIHALFGGDLFTSQCDSSRFDWLNSTKIITSPIQSLPGAMGETHLYAPLLSWVYPRFNMRGYDLVLSDSHSFAHGVRKAPGAVHICYYHTPARSLWMPEIDGRASNFLLKPLAKLLKKRDLEFSKNPDYILANSRTTADRIEKFYGRKVDQVIYPPVHTEKFLGIQKKSEDEGYLMWGRLIPYKKIDLAISAALKAGFKLNIVGSGPYEDQLKALAAGAPNINFRGRLSNEDLSDLIANSRACLFPGYEDFGIVPVESLAAGLPVIAFGEGGASESISPECGTMIKSQTVEALLDAIDEDKPKSYDTNQLKTRAKQFDATVFNAHYSEFVNSKIQNSEGR